MAKTVATPPATRDQRPGVVTSTASFAISPPVPDATTIPTRAEAQMSLLTEDVAGNRAEVHRLHERAKNLHNDSHDAEWRMATARRAKASVTSMLDELADLGFAWRDVARMVGVTVPALQKWRKGGAASGDNRSKVASVLAACDIITLHYMVQDIASWFEIPLSPAAPLTSIDLFSHGSIDLVFDYAYGQTDPEELLTRFDPTWRERYHSDFEVFEASDGHRSIRAKA